jgi:LEA14-like dessication related protein
MRRFINFVLLTVLISSCAPGKPVVLRQIRNVVIETLTDGSPVLRGDAVFQNPNHVRMRLKEINVEVFVDGEKSAHADQKLNAVIPSNDEFTVPLEIHLSLKKVGLLNSVLSLLSGKKYDVHFKGFIRVRVHGIGVKVPVDYSDETRLNL